MTEDNATKGQPTNPATPAPTAKSGVLKYIIFGVLGIVVVAAIAVGTVMLFAGGQSASEAEPEANVTTGDAGARPTGPLSDDEILDSLLAGEGDSGMLAMIEENLSALDYEPTDGELDGGAAGMSEADSLEAADWLAVEKKRLTEWETTLAGREKDLVRRESEASRKMLVIEQAESARTANLARLYDGMDSRAVAKLMSSLDDETVVSILPRMKAKNASEVLQLLPPERAAKLSKQMITIAER